MADNDNVQDAEVSVSEDHVQDGNNDGKLGVGDSPAPVEPSDHFSVADAYGDNPLHVTVGPEESPWTKDGFVGVSGEYQYVSDAREPLEADDEE